MEKRKKMNIQYDKHKTIIDRARQFAFDSHEGQTRSDGTPYIYHPLQTAAILEMVTDDPNLIAAGWLHDTIEDCEISYQQLRDRFNEDIADLVLAVTHTKPNTYPLLRQSRRAVMLKFADRLSNLSDMAGWNDIKRDKYILKSMFWQEGADNEQSWVYVDTNKSIMAIQRFRRVYMFDHIDWHDPWP